MARNYSPRGKPRPRPPADLKPSIIVASIATVILLCLAMFTDGLESAPDWALFLGRFHPALLHLPIGFYTVLALLEYLDSSKSGPRIGRACEIVLNYTAIVSALAAILGILLALPGGYNEDLLDRHRWLGSLAAIFAFWLIVLRLQARSKRRNGFSKPYHGALAATLVLLVVVGHDGGTLTHGSGYLTRYLPTPIKNIFGMEVADAGPKPVSVEEADIYQDFVHPIFEETCIECHGPDKSKGDLRLDTYELAMQGGELGDTIVPGDIEYSEVIFRMHLDIDDDERMPPEGKPQPTDDQIAILEWWILEGAPEAGAIGEFDVPSEIKSALLVQLEGPDAAESEIAIDDGPAIPFLQWEEIVSEVEALEAEPNINILRVAIDSPAIRIKSPFGDQKFDDGALAKLAPIATNIVELEIGFSDITDDGLAPIASMPNLEKLYLQKTGITDDGLSHLSDAKNLRYLNLYGTGITDDGLEYLEGLDSLKSLFLWETGVSQVAANEFQLSKSQSKGIDDLEAQIEALEAQIRESQILVDTGATPAE